MRKLSFIVCLALLGLTLSACSVRTETVTLSPTITTTTTTTVTATLDDRVLETGIPITLPETPITFSGRVLIPTTMPQASVTLLAADISTGSEFKVVLNVVEYPHWDWYASFDAAMLSQVDKTYYPSYTNVLGQPTMVGGAGRVEFRFKALKDGLAALVFEVRAKTDTQPGPRIIYFLNIGQTGNPVLVPPKGQFNVGVGRYADDLFFTPGGVAYYGNVQQGDIPNPFPPVESGPFDLKKDALTAHVNYRFAIETLAGQARNNIIRVTGLEFPPLTHSLYFYVEGPPDRFEFTRIGEGELGLMGAATSVLTIGIPAGTKPGVYTFDIGIVVDGVDYGAVPCAVTVMQPSATSTGGPSPYTDLPSPILVNHVQVNGSWVIFSGKTMLPDGTVFRSQLYENNAPLAWWPANKDIVAANGEWAITVPLGENGAPPTLSQDPDYRFKIWSKNNPEIFSFWIYDLFGHPPISIPTSR